MSMRESRGKVFASPAGGRGRAAGAGEGGVWKSEWPRQAEVPPSSAFGTFSRQREKGRAEETAA